MCMSTSNSDQSLPRCSGNAATLIIVIAAVLTIGTVVWARMRRADTAASQVAATPVLQTEGERLDEMRDAAMDGRMTERGSYEPYSPEKLALADTGKVVLFFYASWCPTCRAAEADIFGNLESIPPGVVILKTDYDIETALKKKYGVTYQHTFVQVNALGDARTTWSGSPTLTDIISHLDS